MIAVGTSVWTDHPNDAPTPQVARLRDVIANRRALLLVGDLALCGVLQGLAPEREAALVERALRRFAVGPMVSPALAAQAAANHRALRGRGVTVRRTMDLLIGTFCIERGHALLHSDRDSDGMERFLGLAVVRCSEALLPHVRQPARAAKRRGDLCCNGRDQSARRAARLGGDRACDVPPRSHPAQRGSALR